MNPYALDVIWEQLTAALEDGPPVLPKGLASTFDQKQWPQIAAVLTTSGSTGNPKYVMLSRQALLSAAAATQKIFGELTWYCALPTEYVAGFMTLVRSYYAGEKAQFLAKDLHNITKVKTPSAISLVGTQLYRALQNPQLTKALGSYQIILVGGSLITDELLDQGRAAGLNLVTSYGMSETCGGCVYDEVPLPGVDIEIDSQSRIWISGPQLFSGYYDDQAATDEILVEGKLRTNDRGCWHDKRLEVLGRFDSVVISGGVNIDLDKINNYLASEPIPAVVVGIPDEQWGVRLVLIAQPGRTLQQWRTQLAEVLDRAALPKDLIEVAKLPLTDRGKLDHNYLKKLAEGR
ncbi:MAG: AMP-dependent synthetase [Propionibacterium sp.]|nr:MAG: AMP-dependent synthetase [Propionibacterium sp.]